jgi:hypothetical protein
MEKKIIHYLKDAFLLVRNRARIILVFILLLAITLAYFRYLKAAIFVIVFIFLGGVSKIYHRFFRSTIGIDLVFFTTIMTAIAYRNPVLSLVVGWAGLVIADTIGTRFSYTSVVSLIGLTSVALVSGFIVFLPVIISGFILLVIFEIISVLLYVLLGSSYDKILLFLISHFLFNIFMILSFAGSLYAVMV